MTHNHFPHVLLANVSDGFAAIIYLFY